MERIITVNYDDKEIGSGEKIDVHKNGQLHRAFSVFLIDGDKVLLQKRNLDKYHSGGLIANSCCSHPRVGENLDIATIRRTQEELGVEVDSLKEIGHIIYRHDFGTGIIEYEYDHIFIGEYKGEVNPNYDEVHCVFWDSIEHIKKDIVENAQDYAVWFISAFTVVLKHLENNKKERNNMNNLPSDPIMLMSVVNTKLRDKYSSLENLCDDLDVSEKELVEKLASIDYHYLPELNQFK